MLVNQSYHLYCTINLCSIYINHHHYSRQSMKQEILHFKHPTSSNNTNYTEMPYSYSPLNSTKNYFSMPTVQPLRISIYKHQQNLIFHRFWDPLHTKTSIPMQNNHPTEYKKMDIHIPNFSIFEDLETPTSYPKILCKVRKSQWKMFPNKDTRFHKRQAKNPIHL